MAVLCIPRGPVLAKVGRSLSCLKRPQEASAGLFLLGMWCLWLHSARPLMPNSPGAVAASEPKAISATHPVRSPQTTLFELMLGPSPARSRFCCDPVSSGARFPPSLIELKPFPPLVTVVTTQRLGVFRQGYHSRISWGTNQASSRFQWPEPHLTHAWPSVHNQSRGWGKQKPFALTAPFFSSDPPAWAASLTGQLRAFPHACCPARLLGDLTSIWSPPNVLLPTFCAQALCFFLEKEMHVSEAGSGSVLDAPSPL